MKISAFICCWLLIGQLGAQSGKGCVSGDCINGFGCYRWAAGDYYMGNFVAAQPQGYGVLYYKNGKKYVGNFQKGKFNGEGFIVYPNGEMRKGLWQDNELTQIARNPDFNHLQYIPQAKKQLALLLRDRPQMRQYLPDSSERVYQWVINELAGQSVLNLVHWQGQESLSFPIPKGVNAAHRFPSPTQEAAIWIQAGIAAENMWAGLVFELFNMQNYQQFQQINQRVLYNNCSKEDYIMSYARLEHSAILKLQLFYLQEWLPYCRKRQLSSQSRFWYIDVSPQFEKWISLYTDKKGYPYYPYSDFYDNLVRYKLQKW